MTIDRHQVRRNLAAQMVSAAQVGLEQARRLIGGDSSEDPQYALPLPDCADALETIGEMFTAISRLNEYLGYPGGWRTADDVLNNLADRKMK